MTFPLSLPFSWTHLYVWRTGGVWLKLMESWLEHLARIYGEQNFRTRKKARDVKYICEEGLVLARFLRFSPDVQHWRGRFSKPGEKADAHIRETPGHAPPNLQIVTAFDGQHEAKLMRELNAKHVVTSFVGTLSGYDASQAELVRERIQAKTSKPSRLLAACRR